MIRVNLLPVKRKKKPKAVPVFIINSVLLTLAAVIVSGDLFYYINSRLATLQQQKKTNEATIADMKNKIKEVENYETQKQTLEKRKGIIEQLRKNQSLPVKILSEMGNVLPNGVWLQSMSISGIDIKISGASFTNEDVVNYEKNLKKSALFTDVTLHGTQKSTTGKVVTYQFNITFKVKAG
ncbi:MAG: PilN domain-containing protein [Thermodesulfovibrionales bacterium]|nr:PilN domain-containing protein [Thermodesulfovibrionales bacterium]